MKKILTLSISIALLCFTSISFAGHTNNNLLHDRIEAPLHNRQPRHQQLRIDDQPQNDDGNFYLKIGATVAKAVIHQGCYVLWMFADGLNIQRGSLLGIGAMTSLAHAIYNFDENNNLFRQDALSVCAGVLTGGLIGSLVGISLNLSPKEQSEVATFVALAGGMVTSAITFVEQTTQIIKRKLFFF